MKTLSAALAACCLFCFAAHTNGQTAITPGGPPPDLASVLDGAPVAVITLANGLAVRVRAGKDGGIPVGILAAESVGVQLKLPASIAGQALLVQSLDGGSATAGEGGTMVGADGAAGFRFTAGAEPGLYRILLKVGDSVSTIQFWVPNLTAGFVNPPVLLPNP